MPQISGISPGRHITESSVSDCTHGSFAGSFSCSHSLSPAPLANFFSLSSSLFLLYSLYPTSSSLVSYFWLKDKSRWDLWPYTAPIWHATISMFVVCVSLTGHNRKIKVKLTTETLCLNSIKKWKMSHWLNDHAHFAKPNFKLLSQWMFSHISFLCKIIWWNWIWWIGVAGKRFVCPLKFRMYINFPVWVHFQHCCCFSHEHDSVLL